MIPAPEDRCRVVGRGPNWLFVHVVAPRPVQAGEPTLVDQLWDLASAHFVYRVVLEMEDVRRVDARLASELHDLHDLLVEHGGALRLCGLKAELAEPVLAAAHCEGLHNHPDRHAAVVGAPLADHPLPHSRPAKSRPAAEPTPVRHKRAHLNQLGVLSHHTR
ncbi:MAG: hypothetical protein ACRCT8_07025 [Lacipirellulaceae bacterium]